MKQNAHLLKREYAMTSWRRRLYACIGTHVARRSSAAKFVIVFAAMSQADVAIFGALLGVPALTRVAMFLNLPHDPAVERLITPKAALTLAEYWLSSAICTCW